MTNGEGRPHPGGVPPVERAEVVLPAPELDATLAFFVATLGLRVDSVFPADNPEEVVVSGFGVRVRLDRRANGPAGTIRLYCRDVAPGASELVAPNGTRVVRVASEPDVVVPPLVPSHVVSRAADAEWVVGRAGMRYRDLVPDRQGGRFVVSHIQIPDGGPVPDYVHFHRVRFQAIYCYRGWVRVVYEDQGAPFVMRAGDCVLQPPQIRHRVLEASPWLEVIEVGCPARHETLADHELELPTDTVRPLREFGGQRFVRHEAAAADWGAWRLAGFEARDTGIADATGGLAGVRVARPLASVPARSDATHDAELSFLFVLAGGVTLTSGDDGGQRLAAGDAFVVPAGRPHSLEACSADLELLEVALPAAL